MTRQPWPESLDAFTALVDPVVTVCPTLDEAAARFGVSRGSLEKACARRGYDWQGRLGRPGISLKETAPILSDERTVPEPAVVYLPPPPPVVPVGRDITASLVGDVHAPEENKPAWAACLRWHAEHQPDVIVLNEIGEWLSMSRHGGNWGANFAEDVKATRRKLIQVRSVCPDSRIVLLETNHDTRLVRTVRDLMPALAGRLTIPEELKLDDLGIEWVPHTIPFRLGRLKIIHGHQLASNPLKGQVPENACKRAIQRFGEPGWTVVFFHTHRKGYWMERHDTGVFDALNIPCLCNLAPGWTEPVPTGWQLGFGVAHVGPSGQTNAYVVDIEHGAFVYGGQRYAA